MRRGRTRRTGNVKKAPVLLVTISIIVIVISIILILIKNEETRKQALIAEQEKQERLSVLLQEPEKPIEKDNKDNEEEKEEKKVKASKVKIKVVGNILLERNVINSVYDRQSQSYNFTPIFDNVKNLITDSDITIGNLETNFYNENYTDHNSPVSIIDTIKELKINTLNIANNQNLSDGVDGLIATKNALTEREIKTYGTSIDDDDSKITFQVVNNIKIAFLSYITKIDSNVRYSSEDEKYINIYSEEKAKSDLEYVKNEGAEYIVVNLHTGSNSYRLSKEEHDIINDFLIQNGADIIIGTHQYDIGKMEIKEKSDGKKAFVVNSMGDIISANSSLGMILEVQISRDTSGQITLTKVVYTPTYTVKTNEGYRILDIRDTIKRYENEDSTIVSKEVYNTLKAQLDRLEKLIRE